MRHNQYHDTDVIPIRVEFASHRCSELPSRWLDYRERLERDELKERMNENDSWMLQT